MEDYIFPILIENRQQNANICVVLVKQVGGLLFRPYHEGISISQGFGFPIEALEIGSLPFIVQGLRELLCQSMGSSDVESSL